MIDGGTNGLLTVRVGWNYTSEILTSYTIQLLTYSILYSLLKG